MVGASPPIRFATTADGVRIAYCSDGDGPPLVFVRGWATHLELFWEVDSFRAFFEQLGRGLRVVRFDARGNGLSDRKVERLDLDALTADVEAVMDGLDLTDVVMWGSCFGGPIAITYAARHPERVARLILDETYATMKDRGTPEEQKAFRAMLDAMRAQPEAIQAGFIHTRQDPEARVPIGERVERVSRSINPDVLVQLYALAAELDVSPLLPTLETPTLVLHRRRTRVIPAMLGRELASLIAGAQFVDVDGTASNLWEERPTEALAAIAAFVGVDLHLAAEDEEAVTLEAPDPQHAHRVLETILFTDIVGSTERVTALGDGPWRELLTTHDQMAEREVRRFGGRKIKSTGDGILAIFDGAARAIQCARAIRDGARAVEIDVRFGLHTGEVELVAGDVAGIAVHIAARITNQAAAGQILVSATLKELTTGSGIVFADGGRHQLKGVAGAWDLFAVEDEEHAP